jgi:hypothetical protein
LVYFNDSYSTVYKSRDSAIIWSGFAGVVKTCEDNKINAFAYLNWIQEHSSEVQKHPEHYLPWKFKEIMDNAEKIAKAA